MRLVLQVIDGCTFENEAGNEYQNNAANQLVKFYDPVAESWISFEYDGNGNMIKESSPAGVTSYTWDAENRLIGISKPDGTQVSYSYDGQGRRVSKSVSTSHQSPVTSHYAYDNTWRIMKEKITDQAGSSTELTYNYYNEDTPISITYAGNTYFYLTNGHGDITGLSDSSGTVVVRYAYNTWSRPIDTWSDDTTNTTLNLELLTLNPYRDANYRFDNETGFYYLRNRYYDPRVGRFISKDKFTGTMTEPGTQNRYVYCGNNPVTKNDPFGFYYMRVGGFVCCPTLVTFHNRYIWYCAAEGKGDAEFCQDNRLFVSFRQRVETMINAEKHRRENEQTVGSMWRGIGYSVLTNLIRPYYVSLTIGTAQNIYTSARIAYHAVKARKWKNSYNKSRIAAKKYFSRAINYEKNQNHYYPGTRGHIR